ncbi:MAG: ATP-binding protein [Bacteroidales bacterium]|nr:ATP-binding protein [Bacteroidales bacterium]MBR5081971.1 ATP-binding protein [Bacteroidales bacterium]
METKKRTTHKLDLLTAVEQVVELSKESHLDEEFFKKAAKPLKFISEKMELTKEQSLMLALFIDNSENSSITISDFAKHFQCSTTRIIRSMNDVDELVRKGFVLCSRNRRRNVSYRVPMDVVEAFKHNEKYTPREYFDLTCSKLFGVVCEIMEMRKNDELSTEAVVIMLKALLDNNKHLVFVQKFLSLDYEEDDWVLLFLFSHLFVNNGDDNICYYDLEFFYDDQFDWSLTKRSLVNNYNTLLEEKMIEFNNDDGFARNDSFRMTWRAKEELFSELHLASMDREKDRKDVVKHEEIVAKQLYYDESVAAQVKDLGQLLEKTHYRDICSRLESKGHRTGFTCLFYGAHGTGKTETVLQLARQSGRDIMQVNISQIKSMWVGESEKNIKEIFDKYRAIVEKAAITPILLFNEADAIIGKRQEGAERAVDKMENSIQNIILQEMETLNGILIATTNLAQNMDKAFERRFLYKIKFNKPSLEARMSIWHEMLPSLTETDIRALAEKYDFSGGQIENVARHQAIDGILHGDDSLTLDTLMAHCDNERLKQKESRNIGFR